MTAYYNEFDPGAAAWLRELIRCGLIADGEVDERSILDVRPAELRSFTQCHFFAGIGGWSYALRLAAWPDDRPVWTGSPPCQPFSAAGQQLGRDDARHLAPHFVDLVRSCRPGVLFGEQVASAEVFGKAASGARKRVAEPPAWAWLDDLSDRLEAARYAVGASDFPSAGVGAPHIRQRTFFGAVRMADSDSEGRLSGAQRGIHRGQEGAGSWDGEPQRSGAVGGLVHSVRSRLEGHGGHGDGSREPGRLDPHAAGSVRAASADCGLGHASLTASERDARSLLAPQAREHGAGVAVDGHLFVGPEHASASMGGGQPSPLHGFWRDADWLFCRDGKWRPVEPGTFPLAHGVSGRVGLLRGYGNAINPHAAAQFIAAFDAAVRREAAA